MSIITETNEHYVRAKKIAKCGDFEEIFNALNNEGLFDVCLDITKSEFDNFFKEMTNAVNAPRVKTKIAGKAAATGQLPKNAGTGVRINYPGQIGGWDYVQFFKRRGGGGQRSTGQQNAWYI